MSASSRENDNKKGRVVCPHKKTDYRYDLWQKERKALRKKAKARSFRVELGEKQSYKKHTVTVDTSKARSNLDLVRMCLKELGWREFPFGRRDGIPCDIHWHGVHFTDGAELTGGKVNKFPGMIEVLRKVSLCRALDMMQDLFPDEYDFCPRSWLLPEEYGDFATAVRKMSRRKRKPVFIIKPDEGSQGDGIYLINDPQDYLMMTNKRHVVQEYLDEPLLVEDLKFDFRIYAVVTSLEPLEIYISREGLARFCTVPYELPNFKNMNETYMHLTNYSLNKHSKSYVHTENEEDGSKRTLTSVFRILDRMGYDTERMWNEIEKLITKTIIAVVPELKLEYRAEIISGSPNVSCFQILGFDILLEQDCKPYLLEVNANPSLRIDYEHELAVGISEYLHSPVDEEIKKPLVKEALMLMAPKHKAASRHKEKISKDKLDSEGNSATESENEPDYPDNEDSILVNIMPSKYGDLYSHMRVMERAVLIYIQCLGVRGTLTMGPTAFRTFTRKCKLSSDGFTNADIDILFIDLQKRWAYKTQDRINGLCYQAFLQAFFHIAAHKYPDEYRLIDATERLLDYCEANLDFRMVDIRQKLPQLPKLSKEDSRIAEMTKAFGNPQRRSLGNPYYLDYKNFTVERKSTMTKSKRSAGNKGHSAGSAGKIEYGS